MSCNRERGRTHTEVRACFCASMSCHTVLTVHTHTHKVIVNVQVRRHRQCCVMQTHRRPAHVLSTCRAEWLDNVHRELVLHELRAPVESTGTHARSNTPSTR